MKRLLVILSLALLLAGLAGAGWWANSFQRTLVASLMTAAEGDLTEFAYAPDIADFDADRPVRVLAERHVSGESWQALARSFGSPWSILPRSFESQTACAFEPHHRLEWTDRSGQRQTLLLCFRCGEVSLNGGVKHDFWNQRGFQSFVESIGLPLRPDSDYDQP